MRDLADLISKVHGGKESGKILKSINTSNVLQTTLTAIPYLQNTTPKVTKNFNYLTKNHGLMITHDIYIYSPKLNGELCKVCVLFDDAEESLEREDFKTSQRLRRSKSMTVLDTMKLQC